jgi:hypothetical protein
MTKMAKNDRNDKNLQKMPENTKIKKIYKRSLLKFNTFFILVI